jgi:F0F1-type ATP synthase epsilon subunit
MFPPWRLVVQTPAETLLQLTGVDWVQVPLADGGPIRVLRGHAPLLAETGAGVLTYGDDTGEHAIGLDAGVLRVSADEVMVFSAAAGRAGEEGTGASPGTRELTAPD